MKIVEQITYFCWKLYEKLIEIVNFNEKSRNLHTKNRKDTATTRQNLVKIWTRSAKIIENRPKVEKSQNNVLGYKKWLKFESDDIFKSTTYKMYFFFSFLNFSFRSKFFLGRKSWFSRLFGAFCVA